MPKYFLTKTWGFNPVTYPVLGFRGETARQTFLSQWQPGDWVVIAGTMSNPTAPKHRGRMVAKIRLGTQLCDVEEVLKALGTPMPDEHRLKDGTYRWRFGLPMIEARRFVGTPGLKPVFGDRLPGQHWATYVRDVSWEYGADVVARLDALETEPCELASVPEIQRQRAVQGSMATAGATGPTGPPPSYERAATVREPGAPCVYLLRLEGAKQRAFKVGRSSRVDERVAELTRGLIPAVTGIRWVEQLRQPFPTEEDAHSFEQALHQRLRKYVADGESEIYVTESRRVEEAWTSVFFSGDWSALKA